MKHSVWITAILILLIGSRASAQTGTLELFADRAGTSCVLADAPYVQSVYVFQTGGASSTLVGEFSAPKPACWNTVWLGDNWNPNLAKIGSSQTQILVSFGVCRPLPAFVLEIQYLAGGTATPCCDYEITMATEYVSCDFGEIPMTVGPRSVAINPDASCPCMIPVSTESSTWGRVKSLYR
jgi:hypothetical protein